MSQTYHYKDRTVQYVTSYFEATFSSDIVPNFSNNETKELRFFKPENIPADMALITANWLNDALDRKEMVFVR